MQLGQHAVEVLVGIGLAQSCVQRLPLAGWHKVGCQPECTVHMNPTREFKACVPSELPRTRHRGP